MFFYADTFPVRQPHLSLSPNIKISPSSSSPNSPFSRMGSPNTVTLVSTEVPAGEPGTGVPSCGEQAGWPWDKQSPCREGPAPLHTSGMVLQEGWCLPGASSSHCLTHSLSLLLKGSRCQCAKDAAASSFYSPHSTNIPPFQQKPQGPHAAQIHLAPLMLNIPWTIPAVCRLPG